MKELQEIDLGRQGHVMREVYPITGTSTISSRDTLDLVPFTSNNKKNLDVIRKTRDGYMQVHFKAPTPITDFEAKTSLSLFKMCLDARANIGDHSVIEYEDKGSFIEVRIDVRDMTRFITGRTTVEQRVKVYKSLAKIRDMSVTILTKGMEANTSWIYQMITEDNYETATLWINKTALNAIAEDKIAWDLKHALQFRGRGFLLYLHLQSWKYEAGSLPNGKKKYGLMNRL